MAKVTAVDAMANRMLEAVIGTGVVNPLEGVIRAGVNGDWALGLLETLKRMENQPEAMADEIARFAAACARIAVRGGN